MDDAQRGPLARSQAPEEAGAELTLRPRRLAQYFGQDAVKESTVLFLVVLQVCEAGVSLGERSSAAVIIVDDD